MPVLQPVLDYVPQWFIEPGVWLLEHLFFTIDSNTEIFVAFLISLRVWSTFVRLCYFLPGRFFGFADTEHYHWFVDWLPWRPLYNFIVLPVVFWAEERIILRSPRAMARIASNLEAEAALYRPGDILFGRLRLWGLPANQPVGGDGDRHLVMVAGAGGGKTTLLITILAKHLGTAFIVDPKGQITRALASRLGRGARGIIGKGKKFCTIDPFGLVKDVLPSAQWNPLDEITRAVQRLGQSADIFFAKKIAEFLIIHQGDANLYWTGNARIILTGVILWVYHGEKREQRNLMRVYELLTLGLEDPDRPLDKRTGRQAHPIHYLFSQMAECSAFRPAVNNAIKSAATQYVDAGDKGRGIMMAAIREQMSYLMLEEIQKLVQRSSFSLDELHAGTLNLSLVAPVGDIRETISGFFRLFTGLGLYTFESINEGLEHPCIFAIDEMPSLGYIQSLASAAPVLRSFGVRLLVITQDLERLQMAYPKEWGGFLGNAEAVYWMSSNHDPTLQALEEELGKRTTHRTVQGGVLGQQVQQASDEPLMRKEQIKRFLGSRGRRLIVTRNGLRPLFLKNEMHFRALPVYHYERDPKHGDKPLRALTRLLCRALIPGPQPKATAQPQTPKPHSRPQSAAGQRSRQAQQQSSPQRPTKTPQRPHVSLVDDMPLETAKSIYGLMNGHYSRADILSRDADVMASGHGNAAYEEKAYQARAVLLQHAGEGVQP